MSIVESRLDSLGLKLPQPATAPPGFSFSFEWVRVHGTRVFISGHSPQNPDGSLAGPFGKVPSQVPLADAADAGRLALLAMLGNLKRAIGDLDRVTAWLMVNGMVNADPGYPQTTNAINGASELIIELFGPTIGAHARTAVGYSALPLNNAIVIAAELEISP